MIRNIVTAADDNYALGVIALISSITNSTPDDILTECRFVFGFVESDLSTKNLEAIRSVGESSGMRFETRKFVPGSGKTRRHITSTTFAKFFFLDSMQEPFLWLDCDAIVLRGWHEILSQDQRMSASQPYLVVRRPDDSHEKFNAGVFASLPGHAIADWEERVGLHELSLEQHIFQAEMSPRSVSIRASFNVVTIWGGLNPTKPRILHFAGPLKPWHLREKVHAKCIRAECSWAHWFAVWRGIPRQLKPRDLKQAPGIENLSNKERFLLRILNNRVLHSPLLPSRMVMGSLFRIAGFRGETHPFH